MKNHTICREEYWAGRRDKILAPRGPIPEGLMAGMPDARGQGFEARMALFVAMKARIASAWLSRRSIWPAYRVTGKRPRP